MSITEFDKQVPNALHFLQDRLDTLMDDYHAVTYQNDGIWNAYYKLKEEIDEAIEEATEKLKNQNNHD